MKINSIQNITINTYTDNNSYKTQNRSYNAYNTSSITFTRALKPEPESLLKRIKDLFEYPIKIIKNNIKKRAEAKQLLIDEKRQIEAEEEARRLAIIKRREQLDKERKLAEEKAKIERKQAEKLKIENYRTSSVDLLAIEYNNYLKANDHIWARHIKNILKEKGFVLIDGKPVKEFTPEAYRQLEVLPYDELSGATFIPRLGTNPPLIENANIVAPPARGNYTLANFSVYNLNYAQRGFGQVKYPGTIFSANTGMDIPAKERGWAMSHSYRGNLMNLDKVHYCTTLSYNHEKNIHGFSPGFSIHIEGQIPEADIEKIKNLLINNGHMEKIIKAEGKEEECGKIFIEIINEIMNFLNSTHSI